MLKPGQRVNADLYCEQLDEVNQSLIEKCSAIVNKRGVILQHEMQDRSVKRALAKINELGWEVVLPAPYLPKIAQSDFNLFSLL